MKLITIVRFVFLFIFCVACDNQVKTESLTVGVSADNPPYEFMQNGQIVGFDIDLINAMGERLGKKIVIKNFDFSGLLAALVSKNIDIAISGLTVTEEREKHVSFSIPYMTTKVSILYRLEDNLRGIDDLQNKVIGVQLGTTWGIIANDLSKKINIKISHLSNNLMLVEELRAKVIDAIILEELQSQKFIENNQGLASFLLKEFSSEFAVAMAKNSELIKEINKVIKDLEEEGELERLEKKWFKQ